MPKSQAFQIHKYLYFFQFDDNLLQLCFYRALFFPNLTFSKHAYIDIHQTLDYVKELPLENPLHY